MGRFFHSTTMLTSADRSGSFCVFHPFHDDFACVTVSFFLQPHSTIRPVANHFGPTAVSLSSGLIPAANSHLSKQ
ncbi:hypothetical protein P692DRAFT_20272234 [Suillus brevipes Sb2]|nr:hypothetical protein P692DRAFT_20272234 [Suillus brevipes Sb2]